MRDSATFTLGQLGDRSSSVVGALLARLEDSLVSCRAAQALGELSKKSRDVAPAIARWIDRHQDYEYLGYSIDALWDAVVEEPSR